MTVSPLTKFKLDILFPKDKPNREQTLRNLLELNEKYVALLKTDVGRKFMPNNEKRKQDFIQCGEVIAYCQDELGIKWKKATSIEFDTKKQAKERLNLLNKTNGFRNIQITDQTTNGKYRVSFETICD